MTEVGGQEGNYPDDKLIKMTAPGHPLPARAERNTNFIGLVMGMFKKKKLLEPIV